MSETIAKYKNAPLAAQKVRLVADLIRGKRVEQALNLLTVSTKSAAHFVKKTLESAISNAEHNEGMDIDELNITRIFVDEGPSSRRFHARAKGRANRIIKRQCHITVAVSNGKGGH